MLHHYLQLLLQHQGNRNDCKALKSIKKIITLILIHKEITLSRHDAALQAQLQPLHSLTKWRLCCNRALNVWQVVINKGIFTQCATTVENELLKYTTTVHHKESTISYNIVYAFEKPNTIVS